MAIPPVKIRCELHGVHEWRGDIICTYCGTVIRDVLSLPQPPMYCPGPGPCSVRIKLTAFGLPGTHYFMCPICAGGSVLNPRRRRRA